VILDATAIVSLLAGELGAGKVEKLLDGDGEFGMSEWNRVEALDYFLRRGAAVAEFDLLVDRHGIDFVAVDRRLATYAAEIRSVVYHRELCSVSLADCIAVALALYRNQELVTSDAGQVTAASLFDCAIVPFKNSLGNAPHSSVEFTEWAQNTDRQASAGAVLLRYR
jgi:uncharacterized protein with PIN domain